jgi:T6SS immunity protein Tdi1, C-terminal
MTLRRFLRHYRVTHDAGQAEIPPLVQKVVDRDSVSCMHALNGKTFNHGIYRVYRADEIEARTDSILRLFTPLKGRICAFAADWLGRQFVIDFTEQVGGKPTIVCLEPGVPDSFCTDLPVLAFHNEALVDKADAALAMSFHRQWRKQHSEDLSPTQCVGYRIPLFLGGKDDVDNLEVIDMSLYVELCAQLWHKTKHLPDGMSIGEISIGEG